MVFNVRFVDYAISCAEVMQPKMKWEMIVNREIWKKAFVLCSDS